MVTRAQSVVTQRSNAFLLPLYAGTLMLSALLLFWMQPMFAKMVLPLLGGTPAVWNTAMVFFQASLLAGYTYAHLSTRYLDIRRQTVVHLAVMLTAFIALPVAVKSGWTPPAENTPVLWLLGLLTVSIGLPFFAVSTTAPLLQKWFSHTQHRDAKDPYFLYAASNLGSIGALVAYPVLVEPFTGLVQQGRAWATGYALLVVAIVACAFMMYRHLVDDEYVAVEDADAASPTAVVNWRQRAFWVVLAFVPSSLLLGVTTHITTDMASAPLLWVIPLILYLLTFVIVFSKRPILKHTWMVRIQAYLALVLALLLFREIYSLWLTVVLHLLLFFVNSMVCHGELARRRPATSHLTEFYLWMSLGGVLGGSFNALVAPVVFQSVFEYPLVITLAVMLRPVLAEGRGGKHINDLLLPIGFAVIALAALKFIPILDPAGMTKAGAVMFLVPAALIAFSFSPRPLRFGLGIGAIMMVGAQFYLADSAVLERDRSFFGVQSVVQDPGGEFTYLIHGTTIHGAQAVAPAEWRDPLTYFTREGPVGQTFAAMKSAGKAKHVGVVGLGIGAMACYRAPGDDWTFYEIDPMVERVARDERFFHYMSACAPDTPVVMGDARLSLEREPAHRFDLFVLDAFSSDSIPMHLITREAIALYLDKLSTDGVLLFHISNKYLDLQPVLGNLAHDLGLVSRVQQYSSLVKTADGTLSAEPLLRFRFNSTWVLMARDEKALATLADDDRWSELKPDARAGLWTDDFSNIVRVLRWK